jgi:CBS domain-containing protein
MKKPRRPPERRPSTPRGPARTRRRAPTGISNQPPDQEREHQARLPPRGAASEPGWARQAGDTEAGELAAATVADVMTEAPASLDAAEPVSRAARAMRERDIGDVLVTQDGRLVGILTDRDIVVRVVAAGQDPGATEIGAACSRELTLLAPGDSVETAIARMRERAVRRLPVVDGDAPVGVVALGDLAVERTPRSALGGISAAPPSR